MEDQLPAKIFRADPPHLPALMASADDLIAMYLETVSPATRRAYGSDYRDFGRFLALATTKEAIEYLTNLSHGDANRIVLGYRSHLVGRELAPKTVNRRLTALSCIVDFARTIGRIVWHLDVKHLRTIRYRDVRGPGAEGWARMRAVLESEPDGPITRRNAAILRLLHDRGLRRGEVVGLDLAHVDMAENSLSILGKGRSERESVTIGRGTAETLRRWIEARGLEPGPLFVRLDTGANYTLCRLSGESVRKIVAEVGAKAGIDGSVAPHSLRHQAVTDALDRGVPIRDVQQFSRHKDLNTLQIYDDRRTDVGGKVAKLLGE